MMSKTNMASLPSAYGSHYEAKRRLTIILGTAAIGLLVLIGGATTPGFLTLDNLLIVIRAASITGIVALGMSYITISGNLFALSAEELAVLSACVFAWLVRAHYDLAAGLVLTLVFSGSAGGIQGAIIAIGADPIFTNLAFVSVVLGVASLVWKNNDILFVSVY